MNARSLALALTLLAQASAFGAAKDKGKVPPMNEKPNSHRVAHWLVLGPVADALPLFHEEDRGKFEVGDLLKSERGPSPRSRPERGAVVAWAGGATSTWTDAASRDDGTVLLSADATRDGRDYASAWLASTVTVDRFQAFDVEITGTHPRRLWIDGEPVVSGGLKKEGEGSEAKGSAKLEEGTHAILVETVYEPGRNVPWTVGVKLVPAKADAKTLPVVGDAATAERDLTLADVLDLPQISSVAVSPDGTLVAAGIARVVAGSDDGESWLEVRAAKDGGLVRTWRGGVSVGQVGWAPVGRKLSYVARDRREGGKESATLWTADLDTGAVAAIVERVEGFAGYRWAPDGASVVYSVTKKAEPDARGVRLRENLLDRETGYRDKSFLWQVAVPGGATRRLTAGGVTTDLGGFSPDGKRLLVVREVQDTEARPFTRKEIWEVTLDTLYGKKLRDCRWLNAVQYAPDGKRLLLVAGPSEFGDLGRAVPEGTIPNETDGQLYLFDPSTGQAETLTRNFDPSVEGAFWSRADGKIYLRVAEHDGTSLYRYDPSTKDFARLDAGGPVVHEFGFAERAAVGACAASGPWRPESLSVVDLGGGAARTIATPAADAFANVRTGKLESFVAKAATGASIDGRVYLPPGFDPSAAAKYPAIVYYYGGTLAVLEEYGGRYPKEWWAAHGYVVYVPEPSGATGYGQARSAAHVNDWGKIASEEILDGTRAFLAAYPAVDPKRVGCIGASYGGFMTMLLVTKTDLFAAAVAHAGISNLASYWGEGNWGYSYGALATADSYPWNRKDIYVDRSPLYHADKVKTPILLTHGAVDTNVPPGESESFYTALKLTGAPVELLTVEGQDHHIVDHAKRKVWSRSILAWFDRWLKGQPAWWDDLYPKTQPKDR